MTLKSISKLTFQLSLLCSFLAISQAEQNLCSQKNIATSSIYYVPTVKDYCPSSVPCKKFKRQVKMQGSGTLPGNKLLTYKGKVISMGSCDTAFGASGKCLIPYISVAADPHYYSMGDIIQMPSLKGRVITLPNGKTMIHPGYFIVQDTGWAIKGANRFDFFTGSYGLRNANNTFGAKASQATQLLDQTDCSARKEFSVVRRDSVAYENSLASIEDALRSTTSAKNMAVAAQYSTGGTH